MRCKVEHEKRNSTPTSNHELFHLLNNDNSPFLERKIALLMNEEITIHSPRKKVVECVGVKASRWKINVFAAIIGEISTHDFGLRMVKALPFICKPDGVARRRVTCQQLIGDIKHKWKIIVYLICVVTTFFRAWNLYITLQQEDVDIFMTTVYTVASS